MGAINILFFSCAKGHFARNLLLLSNTNRIVSDTYLISSRSHIYSTYNRLSGTRRSMASVKNSHHRTRYITQVSSIIPQQTFGYSTTVDQNKIHLISP